MATKPSAARGRAAGRPPPLAMMVRQAHAYLSVLVAPTVLFFAFTGALQLFSLHEAHGDYRPPPLIEKLGSVHKDQRFALGEHHRPPAPANAPAHAEEEDATPIRELALKWLFLVASISLMTSTLLGLWMALTQTRRRGLLCLLLLAGAAAPVAILVV